MADIQAFSPIGNTTEIDLTTSASTAIALPNVGDAYSGGNHRLVNDGPDKVFFAIGASNVSAVIPTNGSPANGIPLKAGASEVFCLGVGQFISAICPTSTAKLYITGGQGT